MNIEWVRRYFMSMPNTTEQVQWGEHLVFKVGGKIYTILALEPAKHLMSFKVDPETFAEVAEVQKPFIGKEPLGTMSRERWATLISQFKELGDISQTIPADDCFRQF